MQGKKAKGLTNSILIKDNCNKNINPTSFTNNSKNIVNNNNKAFYSLNYLQDSCIRSNKVCICSAKPPTNCLKRTCPNNSTNLIYSNHKTILTIDKTVLATSRETSLATTVETIVKTIVIFLTTTVTNNSHNNNNNNNNISFILKWMSITI